jgi:hypothetical protein
MVFKKVYAFFLQVFMIYFFKEEKKAAKRITVDTKKDLLKQAFYN